MKKLIALMLSCIGILCGAAQAQDMSTVYNETDARRMMTMAIDATNLGNSYDYLTKAKAIISGIEGDTTVLESELNDAAEKVNLRPESAFISKAIGIMGEGEYNIDVETFSRISNYLLSKSGVIRTSLEAELIFGTERNMYKDSLFYQLKKVPMDQNLNRTLRLARVLILANNDEVKYGNNVESIVDLFVENPSMKLTYCGNGYLDKLTKNSYDFMLVDKTAMEKFSTIETHIELDAMMKSSVYRY